MDALYSENIPRLMYRTPNDAGWILNVKITAYDRGRMQVDVYDEDNRMIAHRHIASPKFENGWEQVGELIEKMLVEYRVAVQFAAEES